VGLMRRIQGIGIVVWLAVAVVATAPLAATAAKALTHVEHPNVLVTADPEASSQNEVTIAAFPNNPNVLVATARDTRQASGFSWAGYYRSTDGGETWANALVPGFPDPPAEVGPGRLVLDVGFVIGESNRH